MPQLSFYDKKHVASLLIEEGRINRLFYAFIRAVSADLSKWQNANNRNSVWVRNSRIENAIDRELIAFNKLLEKEILSNTAEAWKYGNLKNDDLVKRYIKGMALNEITRKGLFSRNLEALEAFQKQDFAVSDRVWNITKQTKGHIELYLSSGIAAGQTSEGISRDLRHLLNQPDKRFRRLRNEKGVLVPSAPMKNYNPGRGVYRSAAMNAKRLAVTQKNMAYRLSDHERWNQIGFIQGYEVKRSQNHKPCPICDAMKGKYPKEYIFPGWHPFCICYGAPILMNHEDFANYLLTGEIPTSTFISSIPASAAKWIKGQAEKGNVTPLFVKMNKGFYSGETTGVKSIKNRLKKAFKPKSRNLYVAFEPFSPVILNYLGKLKTRREKQKLLSQIMKDEKFKLLIGGEIAETVMHPLHKWKTHKDWQATKQMAKDLNKAGIPVAFLPEYNSKTSADAIVKFKRDLAIADFKHATTKKFNTLYNDLNKGFAQSGMIVLKLKNMDLGVFRDTIEYMKRNKKNLGDLLLITKKGKVIPISYAEIVSGKYLRKLKGKL